MFISLDRILCSASAYRPAAGLRFTLHVAKDFFSESVIYLTLGTQGMPRCPR